MDEKEKIKFKGKTPHFSHQHEDQARVNPALQGHDQVIALKDKTIHENIDA